MGVEIIEKPDDLAKLNVQRDLTDNGVCTGCGQCCSDMLPLTKSDITRITKYINANNIKPISHIPAILANPAIDMVCPFMDESVPNKRHCVIYPVRPVICRYFICSALPGTPEEQAMFQAIMRDKSAISGLQNTHPVSVRRTFFGQKS